MKTKSHSSLLAMFTLMFGMLLSLPLLAERPYAEQSPWATPEQVTEGEDSRPAAADEAPAAEAETISESATQISGDVLNMPTTEPAPAAAPTVEATAQTVRTLDFPRRGMTQDKVQNELGRPAEIVPAVGTPPITRWVYDDRVVYFEYASVIHVVAK
ncbi:MAG: hypothetical protein OQL06_07240 [Gammaproteobacteria bacterium]|nr:hypothetical protein [Gammaproteobacteria bacterium]